ncbi:MAG: PDZ domain-containing protein [Acidobacteriota bacterium]
MALFALAGAHPVLAQSEVLQEETTPATATAPAASPVLNPDLRSGIVRVVVTGQEWNWKTPWAKEPPWTRPATGLVVPGRRILCASTSFGNHLLVEVQKLGEDARTPGRVILTDPEGPLALIEVDEPGFWENLEPLPLADPVPRDGELSVLSWQASGLLDSYPGTVRQVRAGRHGLSRTHLLTLDVATGADDLGSSEVVVAAGSVVGLVTGRNGNAWSAIASPVLSHFVEEEANGEWRGFPRGGFGWQNLTNPALRESLGLTENESGVRLVRVLPHGTAAAALRVGDVILEVAGVPIDSTGHYEHPLYGRMLFALLFSDGRDPGDTVDVRILRDGERLTVAVPLRQIRAEADKIPPYMYGHGPNYSVVGGLIFQELTVPYLSTFGDWRRRGPPRLLIAYERQGDMPSPERPRIVVLSSVLPDAANLGYEGVSNVIVERVNGRTIGSMDDLREAFAHPEGRFHIVEFLPGMAPERLVLDVEEAKESAERIRLAYGVDRLDSEAR